MSELHHSWSRAWSGIGAQTDGEDIYRLLLQRYSEDHRKYHTVQHLKECLMLFETVQALPEHPSEVEFALWFHDAIYEGKASDNEERSAEWAVSSALQGGASAEVARRVRSLIMATKHTAVPTGADEQVLVDIDLSILGASQERFAEYEQQIRSEYSFVPGWLFRRKRRSILKSFLGRKHIYSTPHFHSLLETKARENLHRATGRNAA